MTTRQLIFHPAAIAEAEEVSRWHRNKSKLAATRRAKLPCFPFFLVYRVEGASVEVIPVAHGRRQPKYWKTIL
jgi:hypothetical protein